jgi:acyl-CoA reductase-like NAD-dependent aldehyde dehydrogenase
MTPDPSDTFSEWLDEALEKYGDAYHKCILDGTSYAHMPEYLEAKAAILKRHKEEILAATNTRNNDLPSAEDIDQAIKVVKLAAEIEEPLKRLHKSMAQLKASNNTETTPM